MYDFSGKIAVVTGAAQGLGEAIAKRFLNDGIPGVALLDLNEEVLAATAVRLNPEGNRVLPVACDVSDPDSVAQAFQAVERRFGTVDILVNNAGITADKLLLRMTEADFDNVLATNLKGAFFCTKAACRFMMHQRYGRIISVSSVVGLHGNAGQANYAASKAGLIGLTKSTAKEYAARNITANAVAPGFIATDMTAVLSEPARAAAEAAIPAGKIGHAEDVAAADDLVQLSHHGVLFLLRLLHVEEAQRIVGKHLEVVALEPGAHLLEGDLAGFEVAVQAFRLNVDAVEAVLLTQLEVHHNTVVGTKTVVCFVKSEFHSNFSFSFLNEVVA